MGLQNLHASFFSIVSNAQAIANNIPLCPDNNLLLHVEIVFNKVLLIVYSYADLKKLGIMYYKYCISEFIKIVIIIG